jgi:CheY-like chemotaxis protein
MNPMHVLVADDDAVSLQFLVAALRELGCEAEGVAAGAAALVACARGSFDLLLLDRRMPDIGGAQLLRELRERGCATVAIATSAELNSAVRAELAAAGYAEAQMKPVSMDRLVALLSAHVPSWRPSPSRNAALPGASAAAISSPALLDDSRALVGVGGDRQTLQALRGLLLKELEAALPRIGEMPASELGDWLHRLRASCRYCGTNLLGDVTERFDLERKRSGERGQAEFAALTDAIAATISALKRS